MFGKKRKEQQNTAAAAFRPAPTVHQHAPGKAGEIFVLFFCGLIAVFILWQFVLYVAQEMGVKNPVSSLGFFFASIIQVGIGLWAMFYFGGKLLNPLLTTWKELQETKMETQLQMEKIRLQIAQAQPVGTTRTFGNDARKALIIQTVMSKAYDFIDKHDRNFEYRDKWPWARQQVFGCVVDGKAVTFSEAGKVAFWLEELEIIKDNQVQIGRYPDLNAVIRKLKQTYELPIVKNALPYPSSSDYQHIDL